jgi:hypothetical protein
MNIINEILKEAYPCAPLLPGTNMTQFLGGNECYGAVSKTTVLYMVFAGAVIGQLGFGYTADVYGRNVR